MRDEDLSEVLHVLADSARALTGAEHAVVIIDEDELARGPRVFSGGSVNAALQIDGRDPGSRHLQIPLLRGTEVVGTLHLVRTSGVFTTDDERAAMTLTARAATSIALVRWLRQERRCNERLRSMIAARDELIAVAAHDLRELLGPILLGAHLLTKAGSREGRREVSAIGRAASRMAALLDGLRDTGMQNALGKPLASGS